MVPKGNGQPLRMGGVLLKTKIIVRKFQDGRMLALDIPYEVSEGLGNIGLNEGIQLLLDIAGRGIYTSSFHSGVAHLGVGTFSGAPAAADAGLASGIAYRGMDTGYPTRSGQAIAWRATFTGAEANDLWNEFTAANASGDGAINLFHARSVQGTKTSGQSWELTAEVTAA